MNKKFAKRDILINLLPREYLPEPEFRLFWVLAIVLVGAMGTMLFLQYSKLSTGLTQAQTAKEAALKDMNDKIPQIIPVPVIQANSRLIISYLYALPGIIELGPDWLKVYLELENVTPDGLWYEKMSFVGGNDQGIWPGVSLVGVSTAPSAIEKVLNLATELEASDNFIGVTLRGWNWINLPGGGTAVQFQVDMGIER